MGLVSDHPYFAVTDKSGNFTIKDIPAGTYEVVCWQEKFKKKPLTATVTIGSGETNQGLYFYKAKRNKTIYFKKTQKAEMNLLRFFL